MTRQATDNVSLRVLSLVAFIVLLATFAGCCSSPRTLEDKYDYIDGTIERVEPGHEHNLALLIYFEDGRLIPFGLDRRDGIVVIPLRSPCRIYYDGSKDIRCVKEIEEIPLFPESGWTP
jgi:hypothetical protein